MLGWLLCVLCFCTVCLAIMARALQCLGPISNTRGASLDHTLCLSLPWKEEAWQQIQHACEVEGIPCTRIYSTVGQYLIRDVFRAFPHVYSAKMVDANPDWKGYMGTICSHKHAWQHMIEEKLGTTLIVEDDVTCVNLVKTTTVATLHKSTVATLYKSIVTLTQKDPEWDVLLGNPSCAFSNELVRLYFSRASMACYVVRDALVAERLWNQWPITQRMDRSINELGLRIYGAPQTFT